METRILVSGPSCLWWAGLIIFGIILMVLGLAAIFYTEAVLHILVLLLGLFALTIGIGFLVSAWRASRQYLPWWPLLLGGLVSLLVAVLSFLRPDLVTTVIIILIAVLAIVGGLLLAVYGWVLPKSYIARLICFLIGVLILTIGILMVVFPMPSATSLLQTMGLVSGIAGAISLIGGISLRIWGMRACEGPVVR
jgi:hypothetical protein